MVAQHRPAGAAPVGRTKRRITKDGTLPRSRRVATVCAGPIRACLPLADEIIDKLNKEINAGLTDPAIKARIAELGSVPMTMATADFAKFIADETEKWGKVIRAANIKPE